MPVFKWSDLEKAAVDPEHSSASGWIVRGEKIAVQRVLYPVATEVKPHASIHEQVHSIVKGKAKYRVSGQEKVVGPGEAVLIRPDTQHSVQILEDMEVIGFQDLGAAGASRPEPKSPRSSSGTRSSSSGTR